MGAFDRNIKHLSGQDVAGADASGDHGGSCPVDTGIRTLGTAKTELHDAAASFLNDTGGLGGDQALVIDDVQQSGLNKLGFHDWRDDFDQRFLRENDCSFGNGIDITCKPKVFQIIKEIFLEKSGASQIVNIFLFKMQVFDVINSLVKTAGNGIGTAARILAIKNIKDNMFFGVSFKVALHHGQFI